MKFIRVTDFPIKTRGSQPHFLVYKALNDNIRLSGENIMPLHVEEQENEAGEKRIVLLNSKGAVLAYFASEEAVKLYTEEVSLAWVFAYEVGRRGI